MALDTLKWLKDDLGFTEDEAKALLPQFETRAEKIEGGFLRQSDYSKKLNELKTAETALKTNEEKLNADLAEFAELSVAERSRSGDLQTRIEQGQQRVLQLEQKVIRLAEEHGVDPKTILGDELPTKKKDEPPPAFDPTPLHQQIGGVAEYMLTLNAELPAIQDEHFALTGQRLDTRKFIGDIKALIQTGKAKADELDPVKRWEREFDIPAKRTAAATTKYENDIKAAEERGRVAALSESALPNNGVRKGEVAPVFRTTNVTKGSVLQRPQPSQRLAGAITALQTGKYANGAKPEAA